MVPPKPWVKRSSEIAVSLRGAIRLLDPQEERERREEDAQQGGDGVQPLPLRRQHQVDQQHAQREQREHHHGQRQRVVEPGEVLGEGGH